MFCSFLCFERVFSCCLLCFEYVLSFGSIFMTWNIFSSDVCMLAVDVGIVLIVCMCILYLV